MKKVKAKIKELEKELEETQKQQFKYGLKIVKKLGIKSVPETQEALLVGIALIPAEQWAGTANGLMFVETIARGKFLMETIQKIKLVLEGEDD